MAVALPENAKPLGSYCQRMPKPRVGAKTTHISTLIRHATTGAPSASGERVRLRAVRWGRWWFTTDEWFSEFITALTTGPVRDDPPPRTPMERQRDSNAAEDELRDRGA